MSERVHNTRTYIASERTLPAYAEWCDASGMDHARGRTPGGVLACAIGAGMPTGTDEALTMNQRRVRQRQEVSSVIELARLHPEQGTRANACDRTPGTGSDAMTIMTSVDGRPMTRDMKHLPENEKDRCANTGLLQEVSLVVTVGIRSDRRQTA